MKLYYLASPYSGDMQKRNERYKLLVELLVRLPKDIAYYSSIAMWHHISKRFNLSGEFSTYRAIDFEFISRCDAFALIPLSGWKESIGMKEEWEYACSRKKDRYVLNPIDLSFHLLHSKRWPGDRKP